MRIVVNRKIYDSETAETICSWSNNRSFSDFERYAESLHRTKKGAWFIHAYGGPKSPAARPYDNGYSSGEFIRVLESNEEVLDWMEERGADTEIAAKYLEIDEA